MHVTVSQQKVGLKKSKHDCSLWNESYYLSECFEKLPKIQFIIQQQEKVQKCGLYIIQKQTGQEFYIVLEKL